MLKCANVLKKTSSVELHFEKNIYICISRSILVINICNQGKTLCSPNRFWEKGGQGTT